MPTVSRRRIPLLGLLLLATTGSICDDEPTPPTSSIALSPPTLHLEVGQTGQITANVFNVVGEIQFSSSKPSIASVNASTGLVTAIAEGTTTITAVVTGTPLIASALVIVSGEAELAVVLNYELAAAYQPGDTIALSRIQGGRVAGPDACDFSHLHSQDPAAGIFIDGNGPYFDEEPGECGFGSIISL